jgi:4'-phosphopantetheinyl transferase
MHADNPSPGGALDRSVWTGTGSRLKTTFWLIQTAADVPAHDEWLAPREREALASLRFPKRRGDWRLGRWTAKQALTRLIEASGCGVESPASVSVETALNGAPFCSLDGVPLPWPISISHSHDRALCALGPATTRVGCDLERVEPRVDEFRREWFTEAEQRAIAGSSAAEVDRIITLFWSAKESALKALGTGLTVSTDHVSVTIDESQSGDAWNALHVNRPGNAEPMLGWWRRDGKDIITVVTVPAVGQPVALNNVRLPG